MFATTEQIKVKPSDKYRFVILTCPVGPYYLEPVRVMIDTVHARATEGGVGFAKAAGNYAAALYPAKLAQDQGYHQLIWTDAKEHKYIEESGTMNIMFIIDDKLVTPSLDSDTILPGVTRESVIALAGDIGIQVEERKVTVEEIVKGCQDGTLTEAFGTGTAASVAPVGTIAYQGVDYELPPAGENNYTSKFYKAMDDLKTGKTPDPRNWVYPV